MQGGIISQSYSQYLIDYLGATVIPIPQNTENFFKSSLCLSISINPVSLKLKNLVKKTKVGLSISEWQDNYLALCLFLYEQGDLDILTSFWNTRWFHSSNKLLLSKQEFLNSVEHYLSLILLAIPSLKAIQITANISREEAQVLQSEIKSKACQIAKRDMAVWISYCNFYEKVRKVAVYEEI
ncbi:MAG: hypothetical protein AAFN00_00125 [Cyanobacteria bacterium J06558_2]